MLKKLVVLLMCFIPVTAYSAQFDIWQTGMTLSAIVETARQHDIPLRQDGVVAPDKGFDQTFIDERFRQAEKVGYSTRLLGVEAKVVMQINADQPRRLSEIDIQFAWQGNNPEFKNELLNILVEKYGRAEKVNETTPREAYRWEPSPGDEVLLTIYGAPKLTYSERQLKEPARQRKNDKPQNQVPEYRPQDAAKF